MIGVIGAGTMGSGIAIAFANAGYDVTLVDGATDALERSRRFIATNYALLVAKGRLDEAGVATRTSRITHTLELGDVAVAELIVEAVFESLEIKTALFARLGSLCSPDAILATNTSTLDVDAIAGQISHPHRCLGLHFFSPAHIMKLVEVVRGARTSAGTIDAATALARAIGKTPVVVENADGFVGNRMLLGYRREAEFLVMAGAQPRAVDAALEAFGFALGPFAVSDLAGIDIGVLAKHERTRRGKAPRYRLTDLPDRLVESGRLGRKTGAGYYRYDASRAPEVDAIATAIIAAERARFGLPQRSVGEVEIVERCVYALVNEGARILEAGIAASPADIDTIWRLGYGFPAARGGPLQYAASIGYAHVVDRIDEFGRDDPDFWSVAPLLRRWALDEAPAPIPKSAHELPT